MTIKKIIYKFFLFLFFFGFLHSKIYSQNLRLIDYQTKDVIIGALVKVYEIDSISSNSLNNKFKKRQYSNEKGLVSFNLHSPFRFNISHISYEEIDTLFNVHLDTITLSMKKSKTPLNEIVVTAQIGEELVYNSVNSFILLSNKNIQENASTNLVDLLNTQALFDIQVDPVLGSGLSIQGMDGNNVNILVDGIPILGRKGGNIDLSQINLSNVDRVEILKGPAAVSYGTNSTGGVINLITNTSINDLVSVNSYFESIGLSQYNISAKKNVKSQNFQFNIGSYDFSGYGIDTLRSKEWNPKKQKFGDVYWEKKIGINKLQLKSSIFQEEIVDLGNENFPPFNGTALDNYYLTYRNSNYLKFNRYSDFYNLNNMFSYSVTKFNKNQYNVDLISNSLEQTLDPEYNAEDFFRSAYSRLEYNRFSSDIYKVQIGLDFNYEEVKGPKIQGNEANIFEQSLFFQSNMKITNNLNTQLGIRFPYHSMYSAPIIPSFYLKYDLSPKISLRSSYARGFRAPSIKELFMEFVDFNHNIVGNSNLEEEKSHAFQSSISYFPYRDNNKYLYLNAEFYFNDLENKISLAQIENTNGYTYYNIDQSNYYGFNFQLKSEIGDQNRLDFMWNNYVVKNNILDYKIPRQNFSASYSYSNQDSGFGFNINWKLKSKSQYERFNQSGDLVTYSQDSFHLLNANFSKHFKKINTSFKFGFKNILDVQRVNSGIQEGVHDGIESLISWGRTSFLSVTFSPLR